MQIICGAAMAPALCDTLQTHLEDTKRNPDYYDLIISGDLGHIGKEISIGLLKTRGINISKNFNDCGVLIFDKDKQDTHSRSEVAVVVVLLYFLDIYLTNCKIKNITKFY